MPQFLLAIIGANMLAYCVFLISGIGVALTAFAGIMLIVITIYWWFLQMHTNAIKMYNVNKRDHEEIVREIRNLRK